MSRLLLRRSAGFSSVVDQTGVWLCSEYVNAGTGHLLS
jgi:hypothetical protein